MTLLWQIMSVWRSCVWEWDCVCVCHIKARLPSQSILDMHESMALRQKGPSNDFIHALCNWFFFLSVVRGKVAKSPPPMLRIPLFGSVFFSDFLCWSVASLSFLLCPSFALALVHALLLSLHIPPFHHAFLSPSRKKKYYLGLSHPICCPFCSPNCHTCLSQLKEGMMTEKSRLS